MMTDTIRTRSRGRRIARATGLTILIASITIIALAAGLASWTVQRSFPQLAGTVAVAGLDENVTVQRDDAGVPTITAKNTDDLFYAQGYVQAQDRFWEMDFRRHTTSGRLSELFGESQIGTDKFLRTLGWHAIAEQEFAALDDVTRSYYEAYARGVNAYIGDRPQADLSLEYSVLALQNSGYEVEPWTPADSIAWLKAMAWDLRTNIEEETQRAILKQSYTPEEIASFYPPYPFDEHPTIIPGGVMPEVTTTEVPVPSVSTEGISWDVAPDVMTAVGDLLGDTLEGVGSNSWVVSGQFTNTGQPLLANDPHLGASMPSVWYQMQLRCDEVSDACPFAVSGFTFAGLPGVVIGHNENVAWGFTNLTTDVADLYVERIEGDTYWLDGKQVPLDISEDVIRVAGGADVPLTIRRTGHGPIVSGLTDDFTAIADDPVMTTTAAGEYAVSLAWTALAPSDTAKSIFALNTAKNWKDFRTAASLFAVPAQNLIYADVQGNIGYQAPGKLPIRGASNGTYPAPGWDSAYTWKGYIPFEELPFVENPEQGFIVTANNAIVSDDYPYALSHDWDYGYRAARITELLEQNIARGKITAETMQSIQNDKQFWIGKQLSEIVPTLTFDRPGPRAAAALLAGWDAQNTADSAAAAYANVLWDTLATTLFTDHEPAPIPTNDQARLFTVIGPLLDESDSVWWTDPTSGATGRDAVLTAVAERAYDRLAQLQGEDTTKWNWGALHAITITSATFGSSGIAPIELLFNRGPYAVGGGSSVVDATGWPIGETFATESVPSMRMVIDVSDFDASTWIHLTGASGHAFHPNYVDQTESWARGDQRAWPFSPRAVTLSATDTLVLTSK